MCRARAAARVDAARRGAHPPAVIALDLFRSALLWLRLLSCDDAPDDAGGVRCASVAAAHVSPPWPGDDGPIVGAAFLLRVAALESTSRPVGVHRGDARLGRVMYERATRTGWLRPRACPGHRLAADRERRPGRGWGPRGAWGVSAAYGLRWAGLAGCLLGPAILDVPAVGALVAAGHAGHCARVRRTRDPEEIRACWAGRAKRRADVVARWRR